jgi:hypothetical protein
LLKQLFALAGIAREGILGQRAGRAENAEEKDLRGGS